MNRTVAPWVDDNSREHYAKRVIRHNGVVVAIIPEPTAGLTQEEADANALLIEKAPVLVTALYVIGGVLQTVNSNSEPDKMGAALDAIAEVVVKVEHLLGSSV
jgi:undecaprenyl pyrophosphate phosphatase UppP